MAPAVKSYQALIKAVADIFMVDAGTLGPQTTANDVPGWDSVSQVMLLMRIEDDFGLELDVNDVNAAADLQALAEFLDAQMEQSQTQRGPSAPKTETILVYGNCQAGVYADMLKAIVGSSHKIRYLMSFDHPTERHVELSAEEIATCTLVLEQVDSGSPIPEALSRQLPEGRLTVRFPPLDFNLLWPFNCVDPRNVSEPPDYPFGRFPYGDRIVVELLRDGLSGEALWKAYEERSVAKLPDMQRLRTHENRRLVARDEKSDVKTAPLIMTGYTERKLFWTINHPTGWLLGQVFSQILAQCQSVLNLDGDVQARVDALFNGFEPFGHQDQPIHPEVARQLGLAWWTPDQRYRYFDGSMMTFEETTRRYIDFR